MGIKITPPPAPVELAKIAPKTPNRLKTAYWNKLLYVSGESTSNENHKANNAATNLGFVARIGLRGAEDKSDINGIKAH